ncbi:MAG: response regulator [Polyangiaceae bacterium]|nr:response regulator [Polyangiaceae bacterium]
MRSPTRILFVEDSPDDSALVLRQLERDGLGVVPCRVDTLADVEREVEEGAHDLVVTDFRLPGFTALDVLEIVASRDPDLPVIVVSGTVGEEVATELMRRGARDFVLKNALTRLAAAVERELGESQVRRSERRSAQVLLQTQAITRTGGWEWRRRPSELFCTEGAQRLLDAPDGQPWSVDVLRERLAPGQLERFIGALAGEADSLDLSDVRVTSFGGRDLLVRVIARVERRGGRIQRLTGIVHDETERRQLEASVRQSDRLVAMGTIAAGVAHEINNPLTHLVASLPMVLEAAHRWAPPDPDLVPSLVECVAATQRIAAVVRDLKVFSQAEETAGQCDLAEVVGSVIALLGVDLKHAAAIQHDVRPGLVVGVPAARVAQVLTNLVINAVQAMPRRRAAANRVAVAGREEGDRAVVRVTDNGAGIPEEVLPRIFAPFFTTKPPGVGTGLGLSVCRDLVERAGGTIEVESRLGEGTAFTVRWPLAVTSPPSSVPVRLPPAAQGSTLRVLVIDDEPMLRSVTRRLLRRHDVTAVPGAAEGLALLEEGRDFDVLLCDLMMPGMSGADFHHQVEARFPRAHDRLVVMSGGAVTREAEQFLEALPPERVLFKPFTSEQLHAVLARFTPT